MKAMKLALLGTAALAAASVSARADNLSDLKSQIETLNARVASLEAAPAVPAGYSMVAFSKGQDIVVPGYVGNKDWRGDNTAHIISIMPTADAPAAASTVITWSGYVRAAVVAGRSRTVVVVPTVPVTVASDVYATDIRTKAGFKVEAKTDTAVGEVGVRINTQAFGDDGFANYNVGNGVINTDGFWGYWKMTPNLTLGAGVDGSLAKNGYTYDAQCFHCAYTDFFGGISNNPGGDPAQMRLSYTDGPLGIAIAVEDGNNFAGTNNSAFGVAGKASYAGDLFGADLSAGYWGNTVTTPGLNEAAWVVDAGLGANLGSMASIGAAIGVGSGYATNDDYTKASGYVKLMASDVIHFDVGVAHTWNTSSGRGALDSTEFDAGLYYEPVKQLTLGLEGMYISGGQNDSTYRADFITIFKF